MITAFWVQTASWPSLGRLNSNRSTWVLSLAKWCEPWLLAWNANMMTTLWGAITGFLDPVIVSSPFLQSAPLNSTQLFLSLKRLKLRVWLAGIKLVGSLSRSSEFEVRSARSSKLKVSWRSSRVLMICQMHETRVGTKTKTKTETETRTGTAIQSVKTWIWP